MQIKSVTDYSQEWAIIRKKCQDVSCLQRGKAKSIYLSIAQLIFFFLQKAWGTSSEPSWSTLGQTFSK